jgi:hypothetical protein
MIAALINEEDQDSRNALAQSYSEIDRVLQILSEAEETNNSLHLENTNKN